MSFNNIYEIMKRQPQILETASVTKSPIKSDETMTFVSVRSESRIYLKGLFRIGGQRNLNFPLRDKEYFLVCERFWEKEGLSICVPEEGINLLEMFTITNDDTFLKKVRNNFLHVKLSKINKHSEHDIIGLLRLPLHQFYIAYRDETITTRLCEGQLPVISTDAWVPILNVLTGEQNGELECLLAIGTEKQIESMKHSRKWNIEISNLKPIDRYKSSTRYPYPVIDSATSTKECSESIPDNSKANKTSDLLNMLQTSITSPISKIGSFETLEQLTERKMISESFRIYLEIKTARGLPLNPSLKIKKNCKRNTANKGRHIRFPPDEQPNTYVTFQADEGHGPMVKSHEGMVYSTNVIEKTSNPIWNKSFYMSVPLDYLVNKNKRFIVKIWKKAATNLAHCRPLPCPMEDSIIGFAAINLTDFLSNITTISGWFNIVDFSGHINGQIKLTAQPMGDLQKVIDMVRHGHDNQVDRLLDSFESSLSINNMSLSRAIKRKFTELEEISQRLRARLLDVTGNTELEADAMGIEDDHLDEFEHDLNNIAYEDEVDNFSSLINCPPTTSNFSPNTQ